MNFRRRIAKRVVPVLLVAGLVFNSSCTNVFHYLTQERTGNISVQFINNTPFRASFSFGTYDSLDRNPPGPVSLNQQRLEANSTSTSISAPCRRDAALGTQEYIQRVVDTGGDSGANFDLEAFNAEINFSSEPVNGPGAALPTEGTAAGVVAHLGVNYKCGDQLIFTFEVDPNSPGGFRADLTVVPVKPADE